MDVCAKASFTFGVSSTTTRQYDIRITQFECNSESGGPQNCLQYYTGTTGTVQSFNYPIGATTLGSSVTHLADQIYNICIRRASGYCAVCYFPTLFPTTSTATTQASYGLGKIGSSTTCTTIPAQTDTDCRADYIIIPYAIESSSSAAGYNNNFKDSVWDAKPACSSARVRERLCGRVFSTTGNDAYSTFISGKQSICSGFAPFQIFVNFDSNEEITTDTTEDKNEKDLE